MSTQFGLNPQLTVPFTNLSKKSTIFRPIHYLGSKLRVLDFLETTIDQIDPSRGRIYDLFSGSGIVALKLSLSRPVTSVDIQEYSRVICSALLNPRLDANIVSSIVKMCQRSAFAQKLRWAAEPLLLHEENCIRAARLGEPESLCNLLENGSVISFEKSLTQRSNSTDLDNSLRETVKRLSGLGWLQGPEALVLRLTGGLYFSYQQAVDADTILHHVHQLSPEIKDSFLAPILGTLSDLVNTVGKQFAQPIRPRKSNGNVKPHLVQRICKDRSLDVFQEYSRWLQKYLSIVPTDFDHRAIRMNYVDALDMISDDTTVIYADPPYTRDHYSRYYHTLETICHRNVPEISTVAWKGKTIMSRGVYPKERHQSPFCIKSQASGAFGTLLSKCRSKGVSLVISYSPYDASKKAHPRLVTVDQLVQMARSFYNKVDVVSPGHFSHSKLNSSDKHLEASTQAEVFILCRP